MNISPEGLFRALGDRTRLRCLALLVREGELCVCELTRALDAPQPRISRHLAQLRDAGLVHDRRRGQWVFYGIRPDLPDWIHTVLHATVEAVSEESAYGDDRRRLWVMEDRPGSARCA